MPSRLLRWPARLEGVRNMTNAWSVASGMQRRRRRMKRRRRREEEERRGGGGDLRSTGMGAERGESTDTIHDGFEGSCPTRMTTAVRSDGKKRRQHDRASLQGLTVAPLCCFPPPSLPSGAGLRHVKGRGPYFDVYSPLGDPSCLHTGAQTQENCRAGKKPLDAFHSMHECAKSEGVVGAGHTWRGSRRSRMRSFHRGGRVRPRRWQ